MRAWLVVLLLVACTTGSPREIGTQPSWRTPSTQTGGNGSAVASAAKSPVTLAPTTPPATRYNEKVESAPSSELGDAVTAAVREAAVTAHLPAPVPDARLFRACTELAKVVPEQGVVGYAMVEFALQHEGIIEPSPHLLVVWGDITKPDGIVKELKPRLAEILGDGATARLGVGVVARKAKDANGVVVFALQGSGVQTNPIPRALAAGNSAQLDASIDARFHDPEVFVTHDDGTTERLALGASPSGRANGFGAVIACGSHRGRQQVEVTASDIQGSTVLANFPLWCGTEPPDSMTQPPTDDDVVTDAKDAERRLLALVNRDRQNANLPPLIWDERVADVARAHSEEMRKTKVVAHISPTTGSAADRVHAANMRTAVVLENVARAYGVGEAHDGLMNSPGHRANIMSAAATHIGIGVVLGDEVSGRREMFLTQVFIRIPPKIDPSRTADEVRAKLAEVRPTAVHEARLTSIAQMLAEALAAGKPRDEAWKDVRKRVEQMGGGYARVGSVVTAVADTSTIDGKSLLGDQKPDDLGVGIAQGTHPEIGEGAIWVVILMAEKVKK